MCVNFDQASYTVCEGQLSPPPCLILTGDLGQDVTVTVQTVDDSALCMCSMKLCMNWYFFFCWVHKLNEHCTFLTCFSLIYLPAAPGDYQSVSQEVIFQQQSTVIECIPLTITDDAISEPCERFSAMLSGVTPRVKTGDSVSVFINDDDCK